MFSPAPQTPHAWQQQVVWNILNPVHLYNMIIHSEFWKQSCLQQKFAHTRPISHMAYRTAHIVCDGPLAPLIMLIHVGSKRRLHSPQCFAGRYMFALVHRVWSSANVRAAAHTNQVCLEIGSGRRSHLHNLLVAMRARAVSSLVCVCVARMTCDRPLA